MSPTTPTTVKNTVFSLIAVRSCVMSFGLYIRRPIGSWSGPEPLRELLVDDDRIGAIRPPSDGGRFLFDRGVALVEEAAAHQPDAHGLEVAGGDVDRTRRDDRLAGLHLVALGEDHAVVVVAAERNGVGGAGGGHAGQRPQTLQRLVREPNQCGVVLVSRARQTDRGSHHAVGSEPGIDSQHAAEAREQQAGADEQDEGERDLRHDQRPAQRPRAASARSGSPFFAQHHGQIRRQDTGDRDQPEHEADDGGGPERVGDDDAVEPDFLAARQLLDVQRAQKTQRAIADEQTCGSREQREDDAFDDELPGHAAAAGAERQARRQLLQPRARPHERQVRDVDAADEQHEQRAAPHQVQRRPYLADQGVLQRVDGRVKPGVDQQRLQLRKAIQVCAR